MIWVALASGLAALAVLMFVGALPFPRFRRARHWSEIPHAHAYETEPMKRARELKWLEEERDMKGLPPHDHCGCSRCATWRATNWHRLGGVRV